MKKNWMLFLFFAAISVFTFSACSDDDNDTPDASAVSNLVREAFNSKYPQARSVEWEVRVIMPLPVSTAKEHRMKHGIILRRQNGI